MSNQERQDYPYYDSPQMKDDMQGPGQKQNKKGFYNKYKDPMHKGNQGNLMEDKSNMGSMGANDYPNYQQFRKNQGKKGNYNNYGGNGK